MINLTLRCLFILIYQTDFKLAQYLGSILFSIFKDFKIAVGNGDLKLENINDRTPIYLGNSLTLHRCFLQDYFSQHMFK